MTRNCNLFQITAALPLLALAGSPLAATFTVNDTGDRVDLTIGDGD